MSDTLVHPLMNRAYFDTFAFYAPFRVLDDTFPDFITGKGGSVPLINDEFGQNYERAVGKTGGNTAWQRLMFNLVYNKFFVPKGFDSDERTALQAGDLPACFQRPSTFMESLMTADQTPELPMVATTITELRAEFAEDRFQKVRQFYGEKYTDYLAALGVEVPWSILDEPEVIGTKHTDMRFKTTSTTSDSTGGSNESVGDPAGIYDAVNTLNIRKTFCPEHGLIGIYCVPRLDLQNLDQGSPPIAFKTDRNEYYSPEYLTERTVGWPDRMLGVLGLIDTEDSRTPIYEDLRKGMHLNGGVGRSQKEAAYYAWWEGSGAKATDYRKMEPTVMDKYFQGTLGGDEKVTNFQVTSVHRLTRTSPIRPDNSSHGVS